MALDRSSLPPHLSALPELDFTDDLTRVPLEGPWFRLAAYTRGTGRRKGRIEAVWQRESLLIPMDAFPRIFERLGAVGNVLSGLGTPGGCQWYEDDGPRYSYVPFQEFEIRGTDVVAEPVAFLRRDGAGSDIVLNPDLWLFLELEERVDGSGVWWDARRGVEAIVTQLLDDNLVVVDIQTPYLKKYLQARQMTLLVGHYRHAHLFDPSAEEVGKFEETDELVLGSPEDGVRAGLDNWGLRDDHGLREPFLQRRLHLWFVIEPPAIDTSDPWAEGPSFDPYTFTFPTDEGPVAPAMFAHLSGDDDREFVGESVDFMTHVYFRQEVLVKYQGMVGFTIDSDGSLRCGHYWGLDRSTSRIGNELLGTMIGDFAEGVPYEEWPHWQQYAVEPPSMETLKALSEELPIPKAIDQLDVALSELNAAFGKVKRVLNIDAPAAMWDASLDSLAGKQLQWVYPTAADDAEFLTRATLLSTFVIEGLNAPLLRKALESLSPGLHMNNDENPRPLGSRNLLQRLVLCARLLLDMHPEMHTLPALVRQAETGKQADADEELAQELSMAREKTREVLAPLAFLYDLRVHGGLAHSPNAARVAEAAAGLGLPENGWQRRHYLELVRLVTASVWNIEEQLEDVAYWLYESGRADRQQATSGSNEVPEQVE